MIGDEDADAFFGKAANDLFNFVNGDGVNPGKGFVQQQELGLGGQGAGDFGAPPLAAGQGKTVLASDTVDAEFVQQAFQPLFFFGLFDVPAAFQNGPDILLHGEFAENRRLLGKVGDALPRPAVHGPGGDINVIHYNNAGAWPVKTDNHIEDRSFSRAVGPKQSGHFAVVHGKGDAPDHLLAAKAFMQVLYAQGMALGNGK